MTPQARLRRLQDTLIVVGKGVMAFGVWALAKTIGICALVSEQGIRQMFAMSDSIPSYAVYGGIGIVALGEMALRVLVGRAAVREGSDEKTGSLYLVVAFFLAASHALSIAVILQGRGIFSSSMDRVATAAIDLTSFVTLLLMIYSALTLRWHRQAGE